MKNSEPEVWIVDTITDGVAVLVEASDDDEPALIEMAADLLGDLAIEGAVLIVPLGSVGDPLWDQAERDAEAEKQLRAEAERILKKLKKRDPGGNVSL